MIRDAINKIEDMTNPLIHSGKDGNEYVVKKNGVYEQIRPVVDQPLTLDLTSLDALVKMVTTEALVLYDPPLYIAVASYRGAVCFTRTRSDKRDRRLELYNVSATDVPGWESDILMSYEQALIAARTRFQPSDDSEYLLRLLAEISCGAKLTYADNGIATTVVSQSGVALQENAIIKPIIKLKPYRTFQEINQPESEFHIRLSEKGIRFIESDGGMWKLKARQAIVEFLSEKLFVEVKAGRVVVML